MRVIQKSGVIWTVPFVAGLLATYIVLGRHEWTAVPATR
jgi:hypothetical protein